MHKFKTVRIIVYTSHPEHSLAISPRHTLAPSSTPVFTSKGPPTTTARGVGMKPIFTKVEPVYQATWDGVFYPS